MDEELYKELSKSLELSIQAFMISNPDCNLALPVKVLRDLADGFSGMHGHEAETAAK